MTASTSAAQRTRTHRVGARVLVAGAAVVLSGVPVTASAATPAKHHCASRADFRMVHTGLTPFAVAKKLGHAGTVTYDKTKAGVRTQVRVYPPCPHVLRVDVHFSAKRGRHLVEAEKDLTYEG